jgi:hypothetical protein
MRAKQKLLDGKTLGWWADRLRSVSQPTNTVYIASSVGVHDHSGPTEGGADIRPNCGQWFQMEGLPFGEERTIGTNCQLTIYDSYTVEGALTVDGKLVTWGGAAADAGKAAGNDTEIQYNDGGVLGASSDFTWSDAGKELYVNGDIDVNGNDIILDADGDSYLHTDGDDSVVLVLAGASGKFGININGAEDFRFEADSFRILSGSHIRMEDNTWIGIWGGGRLFFDSTPAPDEIKVSTASFVLKDDLYLVFGDDTDSTIKYDEAGDNRVKVAGADWDFDIDKIQINGTELGIQSATSARPIISVENTNADGECPVIEFYKNSASPANNDDLGAYDFYGETSTGAKDRYAYWLAEALDVTNGATGGGMRFMVTMNGTDRFLLDIAGYNGTANQGEVIINEDGQDVDFRVEASGVTNALFVQGSDGYVGINVSDPDNYLTVGGNTAIRNGNELRLQDVGDSHHVGFEAPALTATQIWVLPSADGGANQALITDGAGNLGWANVGGGVAGPAGADQEIQINKVGVLGTDADFKYDYTNDILYVLADSGVYIGAGSDCHITIDTDNVVIENVTADKDIVFEVNDSDGGGAGQEVARFDGSELSLLMSGNLDLDGNQLILDADGDSYFVENLDDVIYLYLGGVAYYAFSASTLGVGADIDITDGKWLGLGAAKGRLTFNDAAPDSIVLDDAVFDLNGNDLILDADGDSYLHAPADDVVDLVLAGASGEFGITINGAEDFTFTANSFNVLSGSTIYTNTITETTGGSGVTVEGVLLKDTTIDVNGTADAIILDADGNTTISAPTDNQIDIEIAGADDFTFTSNSFNVLSGSQIDLDGNDLILDADGDSYLHASADDVVELVLAGTSVLYTRGSDGYVGIGTQTPTGRFSVYDAAINTTATYYGINNYHTKTAGVTDANDDMYGIATDSKLNQAGGVIGDFREIYARASLDSGTADNVWGADVFADLNGGTLTTDAFGLQSHLTNDGASVGGHMYGKYNWIVLTTGSTTGDVKGLDITLQVDAGYTSIGGNVMGVYIDMDVDIDPTGNIYGIYLKETQSGSTVNYGIYQDGTAPNVFGGAIQLPYLGAAPAGLANGMIWMENDGLHIYYNGAEKTVAGA